MRTMRDFLTDLLCKLNMAHNKHGRHVPKSDRDRVQDLIADPNKTTESDMRRFDELRKIYVEVV
jgi:hypothetical protein